MYTQELKHFYKWLRESCRQATWAAGASFTQPPNDKYALQGALGNVHNIDLTVADTMAPWRRGIKANRPSWHRHTHT